MSANCEYPPVPLAVQHAALYKACECFACGFASSFNHFLTPSESISLLYIFLHTWWNSYSSWISIYTHLMEFIFFMNFYIYVHEYSCHWVTISPVHSWSCRFTVKSFIKELADCSDGSTTSYSNNFHWHYIRSPNCLFHDFFFKFCYLHIQTAFSVSKDDTNYGVEIWCFKMTAFSPGLVKPAIERICSGMCDNSWVWIIVRYSFLVTNTSAW